MRMMHLLDTSAVMAHYLEEPGYEIVESLLADPTLPVAVSSLTWLEFHNRLQELCSEANERQRALDIYRTLLGRGIPADDAITTRAALLRRAAVSRLPNIDAIIAATAAEHGAVLVHRDGHLAAIPTSALPQVILPDKNP